MRSIIFLILVLIVPVEIFCQKIEKRGPYHLKLGIDLPANIIATGTSIYGFYALVDRSKSDSLTIAQLDFDDVPDFDNWVGPHFSETANKASDYLFFGSIGLPAFLLLDRKIRSDALELGILYWQALGITGVAYTMTAANITRYRPLAYTNEAPFKERIRDNAKFSFIAGHPAVVATSTFFMAKVLKDYYPEKKTMHLIAFSSASALTIATSYLRHRAGKHFISDMLAGTAVGVLAGILVPQIH
ncbi:MAG: phosphatase PAP2 family protein, partial [Fulvivirga sp.]|nr:phosphatase PAP2 family protein [Fulvivirga sp.]